MVHKFHQFSVYFGIHGLDLASRQAYSGGVCVRVCLSACACLCLSMSLSVCVFVWLWEGWDRQKQNPQSHDQIFFKIMFADVAVIALEKFCTILSFLVQYIYIYTLQLSCCMSTHSLCRTEDEDKWSVVPWIIHSGMCSFFILCSCQCFWLSLQSLLGKFRWVLSSLLSHWSFRPDAVTCHREHKIRRRWSTLHNN